MARRPRLAAQAARVSLKTPIPQISDNEDEDLADAPPTDAPTPQDEDEENEEIDDDDDQNEAEEETATATPSRSERPSRSATPRRRGRPANPLRKRGRIPRTQSLRMDGSDDGNDGNSDAPTPRRRGGFRGHRGGRWGKPKGGPSRVTQAPLDGAGNVLNIVGDEVELPEDPEGEKKIDKNGYLQDGREYRVRTFTILGRGLRLYMLSTEPARCIGFRDSYLFFQKHKHLFKIIIDDEEKKDLIDRELIPHSYKGRAIGVVTARSVFREFGAKIVIGGRKVVDEYDTKGARERGDIDGELAVPDDRLPGPGEPYNRNQYVAWHGASAVYHTGVPSIPMPNGKVPEVKRKRITVTSDNWMLEHARDASRFNSTLASSRSDTTKGVYDIHTNIMQWPKAFQPTHARWERVEDDDIDHEEEPNNNRRKSSAVEPIYARNFRIYDLCLQSAPESGFKEPGFDSGSSGLFSIPSHILDELPPECRTAFDEAAEKEFKWSTNWLNENLDGHRSQFLPSVEWYPK